MKTTHCLMLALTTIVLALVGCGRQASPPAPVLQGVTIDVPKLREAFVTASPELQSYVSEVAMGVRYSDYPRAFAGLQKLTSAPGLTEPQKKIVSEVAEQVKQVASKAAAPPPP